MPVARPTHWHLYCSKSSKEKKTKVRLSNLSNLVKEYKKMQSELTSFKKINSDGYLKLRKKSIRFVCEQEKHIKDMIKNGPLGQNARFLNLITDMYVNTFNPSSEAPLQCLTEFVMLVQSKFFIEFSTFLYYCGDRV